jgi:hypothetical protein
LPDGTPVLLGPPSPDGAVPALSVPGSRLASALDTVAGVDVLADCGRIRTSSPALEVVQAARYVVVVVTPTVEGVAQVQSRLSGLGLPPGRVAAVTVGQRPYRPDEVGSALDLPIIGALAEDRKGADGLAAGRPIVNGQLLRSASVLGRQLVARLVPLVSAPTLGGAGADGSSA